MVSYLKLEYFIKYYDNTCNTVIYYNGKRWDSNINDFMYDFVDSCYINHSYTKEYVLKNIIKYEKIERESE